MNKKYNHETKYNYDVYRKLKITFNAMLNNF